MELFDEFAAIVGETQVLVEGDLMAPFLTDWTGRFTGPAVCVVRPRDREEVAAVLAACSRHEQPVLPQGGNTGLVGGSVPGPPSNDPHLHMAGDDHMAVDDSAGDLQAVRPLVERPPVLMSLTRLNQLQPVSPDGQLLVGAGATLADVQRHARAAGWMYGVDIAARDSATIGGTVATNAGGIRVCAFGMTRSQVVGLEVVLADGTVLSRLEPLAKDNTGFDVTGLFVGSEGTLGVVTAVRLRLHRPPERSTLALVGVEDYDEAMALVRVCSADSRLLAAEVFDNTGLRAVCELAALSMPLERDDWPHILLIEIEASDMALPESVDAVVAGDSADVARLWSYRERQSEAASLLAPRRGLRPAGDIERSNVHTFVADRPIQKLDVSLPPDLLQAFHDQLVGLLTSLQQVSTFSIFGHLTDANLHIELAGVAPDDEGPTAAVLNLVAVHDGSISAEHGVGRAKVDYLHLTRSPADIAAMWTVKNALDSAGLMSPGVLLPPVAAT